MSDNRTSANPSPCKYCGTKTGSYVKGKEGGTICMSCLDNIRKMDEEDNRQFRNINEGKKGTLKRLTDSRMELALTEEEFSVLIKHEGLPEGWASSDEYEGAFVSPGGHLICDKRGEDIYYKMSEGLIMITDMDYAYGDDSVGMSGYAFVMCDIDVSVEWDSWGCDFDE